MITFRVKAHSVRTNTEVVEVLLNGQFCATIVPAYDGTGIQIISAHLMGAGDNKGVLPHVVISDHIGDQLPIPSVTMRFNPGPYHFENGRIVRGEAS